MERKQEVKAKQEKKKSPFSSEEEDLGFHYNFEADILYDLGQRS